ncbi:replication associated protein [Lacticaseibacillus jixianensis]|uniref:Replication associated protein n=1 Tax=Lacticaseibacillus jixianensis TaxID=2486012 RepID=A0ABW4BAK7_9LACO|nr:replication associated protein [Lacticaseibacillus jixianensis]
MRNTIVPTHNFKKHFKQVRRVGHWDRIFAKPSNFEGTKLPAWDFILNCLIFGQPIPSYFYPHPITPSKRLMQEIKRAVGSEHGPIRVIDLHFDGHNGDNLLVYCPVLKQNLVILIDIGTHADLFQ